MRTREDDDEPARLSDYRGGRRDGVLLLVRVDDLHAGPGERSADEIRKELARIAPATDRTCASEKNMRWWTGLRRDGRRWRARGRLRRRGCGAQRARWCWCRTVRGSAATHPARSRCTSSAQQPQGRPGWRGRLLEFRLDDAANNPQRCWELWDLLLYDKVVSEPNITLLLDTDVYSAEVKDGAIQRAFARCDRTEHICRVTAKLFLDCTGDSRLGLESGAEMRVGHESRDEFGESLAPKTPDLHTQGCSILFTSRISASRCRSPRRSGREDHGEAAQVPRHQVVGVRLLVDRVGRADEHGPR
jgi:hypothetical protein